MRKSFVNVTRPMFAGVVKADTPKNAMAEIKNCYYHGATGIDLHLSCLNEQYRNREAIKQIVEASDLPILALNYALDNNCEVYEITEEERIDLFIKAVEAGVAGVDIQGYTFDPYSRNTIRDECKASGYSFIKEGAKEIVLDTSVIDKQMDFIERIHSMGAEVLFSNHPGVFLTAEEVVEYALFLEKRNPDIIKIVTVANSEEEMLETLRGMVLLKKEVKTPVSYHAGGKCGGLTRVINPVLGGFMIFCNDRYKSSSDFSQPDLETVKAVVDGLKKIM